MNNKGFMMAEVIVVASIILVSLTGFYALYNKTISLYNERIDYYDVKTLYKLAEFRNKNGFSFPDEATSYVEVKEENEDGDRIFLLRYNIFSTNNYLNLIGDNSKNINKTFQEYLEYLNDSLELSNDANLLVMENCDVDKTNCKYAYLETAVK